MKRIEDYAGMKYLSLDITYQAEAIAPIMHALSSPLRIAIVKLLGKRSMNVNELAQELCVPLSTISLNVTVLEKAGIIYTEAQPGARGTMKLCSRITDQVVLNLVAREARLYSTAEISVPIGTYSDAVDIRPTCGLASRERFLGVEDNPASFYVPERTNAQLVWLTSGYLEYRISTMPFANVALEWIEISFEACSEVINYRNEYPSDIFMEINGCMIGSWRSPGDFGGRRGVQNPDWWSDVSTQYGHLKTWRITETGSFLDLSPLSQTTLADLRISEGLFFTLRIGVRPDAEHVGGMNLFGVGFGDFPQDIRIKYAYH